MDSHLNQFNDLQELRRQKADDLRSRGIDPYTPRSYRTHTSAEAVDLFAAHEALGEEGSAEPLVVTVAGRVVGQRHMGKTVFAHLRDGHGQIQIYLRKDDLGEETFDQFLHLIDLNDFVEATGSLFRTKTGEVSVRVTSFRILTKALNPPPDKWHGLQDVEIRYRQRYADLIANAEVREVFHRRAKAISSIRRYLDNLGYLEVETPTLQPLYGGAAARPFTTLHNALDQIFYLRIADELYLKRLIVGGYERVYEICKDFRNEGVDRNHSPEFTMLEFYEAYADYTTIMDRVEGLFVQVAIDVFGEPRLTFQGHEIDLTPPWPRISLREAIRQYSGIDYQEYPDQASLLKAAHAAGADVEPGTVWPRIVDELLKQFVRPKLIQPTLLVDYPVALSPLAKRKPGDLTHVERFQPYIGGLELGNAFTELNDPLDQLARFLDQQEDKAAGDEEAMPIDEDFVNALMYGMPPTGGVGIGIDRLTVLLTDQQTLRDVILFPAMRKLAPREQDADADE
jgi:lysyl-tRNA synthetase class 2